LAEYRFASDDELEACIDLQHLVLRPDQEDAPARYRSYVREDPTYRLGQTRIAVVDGRIVGHLRVWDRKLSLRGKTITAGGIGSLLTHPDYRGQGIASGLLADAEQYFKEVDYDIGLLFSIIGTPFYDRRGWTPIPISTFELDVTGVNEVFDASSYIALSIDRDLARVRELHGELTSTYSATEIRDESYWSTGPARYRNVFPPTGVSVDGKLAGYINWNDTKEGVWVAECCGRSEEAYRLMGEAVLSSVRSMQLTRILGSLSEGHPFVSQLESLAGRSAEWSSHDEMMVKVSRWDLLQEKLDLDLPEVFPENRNEIDDFWRSLLGCPRKTDTWSDHLGHCAPTFYWWTDIF
jgi:predicted N-acetyltransferase YhbS